MNMCIVELFVIENTELTIEEWSGKPLYLCTVILIVLNGYNIHGRMFVVIKSIWRN